MRNLTRYLLWAFVFTVPWDTVSLPLVGSVSRLLGLAVIGAGVLTTAMEGRLRKPDAVLGFAIAFSMWCALSLLWTISYGDTVARARTYLQLVAMVWVIREFVRTREQMETLLAPFCFGMFVPLTDLVNNFRAGAHILNPTRFSGGDLNADILGGALAIGVPMAWHLLMRHRGIVRVVALVYFSLAPLALLLTGTRGAFLAAIVAFAIVPLTLASQSLRSYALAGLLLIVATVSAALIVPQSSWNRILSTTGEITEGGRMSGRRDIWNAGFQTFPQRPLLGAGIGAYGAAVEPYLHNLNGTFPHSVAVGMLVEGGIIGLGIFAALLGACAWTIFHSPPFHRALWGVLILTWLVGALSANWETVKITWLLFGLVAAQSGLTRTISDGSPEEQASYAANESFSTATI